MTSNDKSPSHIPARISSKMLKALAIDPFFGITVYTDYVEKSMLSGTGIPMELYRRSIEDAKPVIYEVDNLSASPVMREGETLSTEKRAIAKISLKGVMLSEGDICTPGIDYVVRQVEAAAANDNIMGIILNTSSGGGEVEAAQRLSNALIEAKSKMPIIQYIDGGMAASGAYWAGAVTDEIIAGGKVVSVGSIGVVIQLDQMAIDAINERVVTIYSNGSEDKHDVMKAILRGDHDYVRKYSLDPIKSEFHKLVKKHRVGVSEDALTGKMFFANEAKKLGLIDRIGTFSTAVTRIKSLASGRRSAASARKVLSQY